MPIKVPNDLPAVEVLNNENIFVMDEFRAYHQDIRPLRIAILNLMPKKIETETQILRLLGNSPLQVDIVLLHPRTHVSKNTPQEYLIKFYNTFDDIKDQKFDGMIITGAPVELMDFEPNQLQESYVDFHEYMDECYFKMCLHVNEPDCAVRQAVEAGNLPAGRYERYVKLVNEIKGNRRNTR